MKIKTTKKLNLPELIRYVWENKVYPCRYVNNFNGEVVFNDTGKFMTDESFISPNSYFTVEVEEELTEDTILPDVSFVYYASITEQVKAIIFSSEQMPTINGITGRFSSTLPLAIYYKDIPTWTSEHGIPADGVLEVDTE